MEPKHPLSKEEIMRIQDLHDRGNNIPAIHEATGYSTSTIDKYIKRPHVEPIETAKPVLESAEAPPLVPLEEEVAPVQPVNTQVQQPPVRQPEYAKPVQQTQTVRLQEAPPAQPAVVLPDSRVLEPHEWLQTFLQQYAPPLKKGFIVLMGDRAKIRRDLPSAAQLTDDIQSMESGVNKLHHAAYIAEIYEHQLRAYLSRKEQEEVYYKRPYRGVGGRDRAHYPHEYDSVPMDPYGAPPTLPYESHERTRGRPPYDGRRPPPDPYYYPPPRDDRLERKIEMMEDERRRKQEEEMNMLKMQIQSGGQQDPTVARLEQKLELLEDERRRKNEEEMRALKMQISQGSGLREQDVKQMIEAERGKITGTDIQRMIDTAMNSQQKSFSEIDLKYKELGDKHKLEVMKIDEKGKTRDTIANAVKGGFSQVGAAIARTASEVGTEDKHQMEGTSDGKNMWQAECPYCNELITAPLSAKIIQCPGCNRRLEVSSTAGEKPKPSMQPAERPSETAHASFNIKQPQFEPATESGLEPTVEPEVAWPKTTPMPSMSKAASSQPETIVAGLAYNAQCPSCGTTMKIPLGAKRIACPKCGKQLEVGEPIEEDKNVMPTEMEISLPQDSQPIPIPITEERQQEQKTPVMPERYSGVPGGEPIEEEKTLEGRPVPKESEPEQYIPPDTSIDGKQISEFVDEGEQPESGPELEPEPFETLDRKTVNKINDQFEAEAEGFECPECGKTFEKEKSLKGHMLHHIRAKKKKGMIKNDK